jgi:putative glutamine amidotransferase
VAKKPRVLIPGNVIDYNGSPGHIVRETYIDALVRVSGALPLVIPSIGRDFSLDDIADSIDGILLTGSPSHVAPACYGEQQVFDDKELDLKRDATSLPLIAAAIKRDIPLIAICRGFQELNVVMGGTLHQRVHEIDGMMDHRAPKDKTIMEVYRHQAHDVTVETGGIFEQWGLPHSFTVNTVHQQGIKTLAAGLRIEAKAPDGLIEAISIPDKKFIVGTQWHPEGDWDINPVSRALFERFGTALRG